MRNSEHFNLNVVDGTDKVNLLTQMNPNTEAIDEQMFKNQNAGVQTATELLNGTIHAITRSIPDASMIRFTAVSRFTAGDTFTVDGVQVSALLPSGEQLPDGTFIIGSEVLCVLKGTLLTVFSGSGKVALSKDAEKLGGNLPSYYATKEEVNSAQNTANSAGNLAETNRQSIIELNNGLEWTEIGSVTGNTNSIFVDSTIYKEIKILVSFVFPSSNQILVIFENVFDIQKKRTNEIQYNVGGGFSSGKYGSSCVVSCVNDNYSIYGVYTASELYTDISTMKIFAR